MLCNPGLNVIPQPFSMIRLSTVVNNIPHHDTRSYTFGERSKVTTTNLDVYALNRIVWNTQCLPAGNGNNKLDPREAQNPHKFAIAIEIFFFFVILNGFAVFLLSIVVSTNPMISFRFRFHNSKEFRFCINSFFLFFTHHFAPNPLTLSPA